MMSGKRVFLLVAMVLVSGFAQSLASAQETPLHKAAAAGDKELVARLLAEGADVNAKDKDGRTPLHVAAREGHKEVVELLLAKGAEVNAKDNQGSTPLHQAAGKGNKEAAEVLLAKGAEVNAKDKNGATPLHSAAAGDTVNLTLHGAVAGLLLAHGADVIAKNNEGQTPLDLAKSDELKALLRSGHSSKPPITSKFLADAVAASISYDAAREFAVCQLRAAWWGGYDITVRVRSTATMDGRSRVLEISKGEFIQYVGPDPNNLVEVQSSGDIVFASKEEAFAKGVPFFISDATLNSPTELTYTVHSNPSPSVTNWALFSKEERIGRIFFASSVDFRESIFTKPEPQTRTLKFEKPLNPKNMHRIQFVYLVEINNRCPVSNSLVLPWSSAQTLVGAQESPLHKAAATGDKELVARLLAEGADVNAKDNTGSTALHGAAREGHTEVVELLLTKGAEVDAKNDVGWTPLHIASNGDHKEVVELLLVKGADIKAKNLLGMTAVHWAVFSNRKEMVELLLSKGADVNAKDDKGQTPLDRAWAEEMKALLRKHGAK